MVGAMPSAPAPPDGFELINNGTARLVVDGQVWRLRRPKLGEFRKLREALDERDDAHLRIISEHRSEDKPADDADAEEKLAFTLGARARGRAISEQVAALNVEWLGEALRLLCDREPPAVDDWPAGMDESGTISALVSHWRSVPLRSGGS